MAINSLSASSHGLSGLASGMDTQQMVESMLAGTQNKIDSTKQKKAQLTEKQTLYRDLITKMNTFKNSFFSYTSANTNLLSTAFFNSMTASSTSNAFRVTAGSLAAVGKTTVNYVETLARNAQAKSQSMVTGKLAGKVDAAKLAELTKSLDKEIIFRVKDGAELKINLQELIGTGSEPNSALEMEKILKSRLGAEIDVSFEQGKLQIAAKNGNALTVTTADEKQRDALRIFGLSGEAVSANGKMSLNADAAATLPTLSLTMNGVKKSIAFNPLTKDAMGQYAPVAIYDDRKTSADPATRAAADDIALRLNAAAQKAFGAKVVVESDRSGSIEFKTVNADGSMDRTSQLILAGGAVLGNQLMQAMGISNGKSSKLNTGMTLAEANFATPIAGSVQKFTINGVDFSVDSGSSIFAVIDDINRSNAGVTVTYLTSEDRFQIESKVSGKLADGATPFAMSQSEGNLLTALFGAQSSGNTTGLGIVGKGNVSGKEVTVPENDLAFKDTMNVTLNVNGVDTTLTVLFAADDKKDMVTFVTKLNKAIADNADIKGKVSFGASIADGKTTMTMAATNGNEVRVQDDGLKFAGLEQGQLTYAGKAAPNTSLEALGLEKLSITLTDPNNSAKTITVTAAPGDTIKMFSEKLNTELGKLIPGAGAEFELNTGRYRMFGIDIPMTMQTKGDDGRLFGTQDPIPVGKTAGESLGSVQTGQNAVLSVNGVRIERTNNNFEIDGITYELRNTTPVDKDGKPISVNETIEISRNTDQIYDGIVKFVEEYNKLVDSINEQLDAEPSFRTYPPLTDKQKADMSDKEIEQWEAKSREGLLRNDATLQSALTGIRNTLYTKPAGGIALYDMGITTSYFGKKDHLSIEDPAKLKQMITENPVGVQTLFTDSDKGLSQVLKQALERAASTDSGSPGMLVREAGTAGRVDTSSSLYRQLRDVTSRLDTLNRTYTSQYDRYWKQFNSMEKMIQQMNQQSGWLSQQFSS